MRVRGPRVASFELDKCGILNSYTKQAERCSIQRDLALAASDTSVHT